MQTADFYSNQSVKAKLLEKVGCRERLIGVAAGSGITGKYTVLGGCDMILALSSGKYRSMGCGSMAGFMCYGNSNDSSGFCGRYHRGAGKRDRAEKSGRQ